MHQHYMKINIVLVSYWTNDLALSCSFILTETQFFLAYSHFDFTSVVYACIYMLIYIYYVLSSKYFMNRLVFFMVSCIYNTSYNLT